MVQRIVQLIESASRFIESDHGFVVASILMIVSTIAIIVGARLMIALYEKIEKYWRKKYEETIRKETKRHAPNVDV